MKKLILLCSLLSLSAQAFAAATKAIASPCAVKVGRLEAEEEEVDFSGCMWQGAKTLNLDRKKIKDANFSGDTTHIDESSFKGAQLDNVNFNNAYIQNATFAPATKFFGLVQDKRTGFYNGCTFKGTHLAGTNFTKADLGDSNFSKADLDGVNFSGADLSKAKGLTVKMISATTINEKTKLPDYICKSPEFASHASCPLPPKKPAEKPARKVTRAGKDFSNTALRGSVGGTLRGYDFVANEGSDLSGANFEKANLYAASFAGADLRNANFRGARIFPKVNFNNADIRGADFTGANWGSQKHGNQTKMQGTRLDGAIFDNPWRGVLPAEVTSYLQSQQ